MPGRAWKSQLILQPGQAGLAGVSAPPPAAPLPKPHTGHDRMARSEGQQAAQTGQPFTERPPARLRHSPAWGRLQGRLALAHSAGGHGRQAWRVPGGEGKPGWCPTELAAQKEMCCNGGCEAQSESGARRTAHPSPGPMETGRQ